MVPLVVFIAALCLHHPASWGYSDDSGPPDPYFLYPDPIFTDDDTRGLEDRRFGRSENYLRFGRGRNEPEADEPNTRPTRSGVDRNKNDEFIRFGRGKFDCVRRSPEDYLRFGRSPEDHLRFGRKKRDVSSKRGGNYNHLRFGRRENSNFVRFGRNKEHFAPNNGEGDAGNSGLLINGRVAENNGEGVSLDQLLKGLIDKLRKQKANDDVQNM